MAETMTVKPKIGKLKMSGLHALDTHGAAAEIRDLRAIVGHLIDMSVEGPRRPAFDNCLFELTAIARTQICPSRGFNVAATACVKRQSETPAST